MPHDRDRSHAQSLAWYVTHLSTQSVAYHQASGLVKTHFYHIWIQMKVLRKTKELRRFHDILSKVCVYLFAAGRNPNPITDASTNISWATTSFDG
jgi:hypothetical protein